MYRLKFIFFYLSFGLSFSKVFKIKSITTFILVLVFGFSGRAQSPCLDVSSATLTAEYPPNSNSQRLSMINYPNHQYYLCGPNTVVIDTNWTLETSCTRSVFVNAGSKLMIRSLKFFCNTPPSIYIKTTGTLVIIPSTNSVVVYAEPGALVIDQSNIAIVTLTTCIVLPQAECAKVGITKRNPDPGLISLFPNPTSENLNISFSGSVPADISTFSITNNLGQIVGQENLELINNTGDIQASGLDAGLYQIHFKTQFGTVTKKFVKVR